MRLLLASSADGYLARGPEDDMKWTGPVDKAVFRLLTLSSTDVLLAGSRTFDQMPKLPGRTMLRLSREAKPFGKHPRFDLDVAATCFEDPWLIGGPTVAVEALKRGLVRRAFICVSPVSIGEGIHAAELEGYLPADPAYTIKVGDVRVLVFTEDQAWRGR